MRLIQKKSPGELGASIRYLGIRNILFLILFLLFTVALLIQFTNPRILHDIRQRAAGTNPHRISWQGQDWYLFGVNVPWYNWGCDFGCNQNGGVSGNTTTLSSGFQKLKDSQIHNVRW